MQTIELEATILHGGRRYRATGTRNELEQRNYVTVCCQGRLPRAYWFKFSRRRAFNTGLLKRAIDRFIQDGVES